MDHDHLIEKLANLRSEHLALYPHLSSGDFETTLLETRTVHGEEVTIYSGRDFYEHVTTTEFADLLWYQVNSDGQHWQEHVLEPEIITLGCSLTAGMGLPWNFTWPGIVQHVSGRSVNNIGRSGHNLWRQADRLAHHLAKYKSAKHVFVLVPDLWRSVTVANEENLPSLKTSSYNWHVGAFTDFDNKSKKHSPYMHVAVDNSVSTIAVDLIVDRNLDALSIIKGMCEIVGAELKFFSWDYSSQNIFRSIGCYPELQEWPEHLLDQSTGKDGKSHNLRWGFPDPAAWMGTEICCDLEPQSDWQSVCWKYALDRPAINGGNSHPGLHSQIHFAEIMLGHKITEDMIKDLKPWYEGTELDTLSSQQ